MDSIKFKLTPKFVGVPYDILSAKIANTELNEKVIWSFINECDDEVFMESMKNLDENDVVLVTNASGGGYESSYAIDGIGDNFGIEEALEKEYGEYKIKEIYG